MRDVGDDARSSSARDVPTVAPPDREDDPDDDEQRICADRHGAEIPDPLGRTGYGRKDHEAAGDEAGDGVTPAAASLTAFSSAAWSTSVAVGSSTPLSSAYGVPATLLE